MPFQIVRNDITKMKVDAIVNTANPKPEIGIGVDSMIHENAGPQLLAERRKIGAIAVGEAAVTKGFKLAAKYVIHTVGPVWNGGSCNEEQLLDRCYKNSLKLALETGCQSVAFPLISAGNYGFPKDKALQIAMSAISAFLMEHEMTVYLVVFDRSAFMLSEKLFSGITSYIDQNYVDLCFKATVRAPGYSRLERRRDVMAEEAYMPSFVGTYKSMSLQDMLEQEDAGFTETLLRLIDESGKKDSEIYKKANLSKQHFSKIRNNMAYKPTKPTAIALALALELDLEQTKDLIGRAGYALTNSNKFDLIIRYFIEQKNYNVVQINIALYEFDQSLLGA